MFEKIQLDISPRSSQMAELDLISQSGQIVQPDWIGDRIPNYWLKWIAHMAQKLNFHEKIFL